MSPFDIVKILNEKTVYEKDEVIANYNAWIINHALSNMMDTLFFAQEMAQYSHLDKRVQYDFYLYGIPKGKRYGKWHKEDKSQDLLINTISEVFQVNRTLAKRYLSLLSDDDKKKLLELEGGK